MTDTNQLLGRYAAEDSEEAFQEVVSRFVDLVYSTALRRVNGDTHLAEDVVQTVFTDLARKAGTLGDRVMLGGWLHRHTCFVAATAVRTERRHHAREKQAVEMNINHEDGESVWMQIAPLLDEGIDRLGSGDRAVVVLRFFERRGLQDVGVALGISEDAARKRVARAVEKLRVFLVRRGVAVPGTALAALLTGGAVGTAPTGLAATVAAVSVSGAATATSTITFGKLMALTNLKSAIAVGACALTAATSIVIETKHVSSLRGENQRLAAELASLQKARTEDANRVQAANDDLDRLRREAAELQKLRGEVAQLRRERVASVKLAEDNARLRQQIQSAASGKPSETQEDVDAKQEEEKQLYLSKMNYLKVSAGAIMQYMQDIGTNVPSTLEAAMPYMPPQVRDMFPPDQYEIVLSGNLTDVTKPERTIMMKEKEPTQALSGKWTKAYGFADGHSEIHAESTPDGFDAWEKARMTVGKTQ